MYNVCVCVAQSLHVIGTLCTRTTPCMSYGMQNAQLQYAVNESSTCTLHTCSNGQLRI